MCIGEYLDGCTETGAAASAPSLPSDCLARLMVLLQLLTRSKIASMSIMLYRCALESTWTAGQRPARHASAASGPLCHLSVWANPMVLLQLLTIDPNRIDVYHDVQVCIGEYLRGCTEAGTADSAPSLSSECLG